VLFSPIERFANAFEGYEAGSWSWANVVTKKGIDLVCDQFVRSCRDEQLRCSVIARHGLISDTVLAGFASRHRAFFLDQNELQSVDSNLRHFQGRSKRQMVEYAWTS
jgi:hypothetical protein